MFLRKENRDLNLPNREKKSHKSMSYIIYKFLVNIFVKFKKNFFWVGGSNGLSKDWCFRQEGLTLSFLSLPASYLVDPA
jgi:hypothetical protein